MNQQTDLIRYDVCKVNGEMPFILRYVSFSGARKAAWLLNIYENRELVVVPVLITPYRYDFNQAKSNRITDKVQS